MSTKKDEMVLNALRKVAENGMDFYIKGRVVKLAEPATDGTCIYMQVVEVLEEKGVEIDLSSLPSTLKQYFALRRIMWRLIKAELLYKHSPGAYWVVMES